jgi:hypothetical protein
VGWILIPNLRERITGMSISEGFLNENERCKECGQFPPDHDPICPNNPALNVSNPEDVLAELLEKLAKAEEACEPDFARLTELLNRIESVRSHIRTQK